MAKAIKAIVLNTIIPINYKYIHLHLFCNVQLNTIFRCHNKMNVFYIITTFLKSKILVMNYEDLSKIFFVYEPEIYRYIYNEHILNKT